MLLNKQPLAVPDSSRHPVPEPTVASNPRRSSPGWTVAAGGAALAGFVAVAVFVLGQPQLPSLDAVLVADVATDRTRPLSVLAQGLTNTGSTFGLVTVLILAVAVLRMMSGRWTASIQLAVTMAVSVSLTTVLKLATARARPPADVVGVPASSFAFPSGHTLNSTVFFLLVAALLSPYLVGSRQVALWLGAAATVVAIGWSRFYLGYHWPTDVVAGWLLGISLVCVSVTVGCGGLTAPARAGAGQPVTRGSAAR